MKSQQFELSRPIEVARISSRGSHERISADPKECAALAKRMDLPNIYSLKAELIATPWRSGGAKVTGKLTVDLDQISVISLELFRTVESFDVERYFLPEKVDPDDEADKIDGGVIDLGEVVTESLVLSLDPYPRGPDESFAGFETDEAPEKPLSPFAQLADSTKKQK